MDKDKIIEVLKRENESLKKQRLELIMENAELKDMVLDNGGEYADNIRILTDGYEAGSPSDYEDTGQMSLFND